MPPRAYYSHEAVARDSRWTTACVLFLSWPTHHGYHNLSGDIGGDGVAMPHRLLVVEDEPVVSSLMSSALTSVGYVVGCAENGADAILLSRALKPNLLIVDVR